MKATALCILILLPFIAKGQNGDGEKDAYRPAGSFGIHVDQDFFAQGWLGNKDRNYTQGTGFSFTRLKQERYNFVFLPLNAFYLLADLVRRSFYDESEINFTDLPSTLSFGVSAYTPETLRSYMPAYGDRPYSSVVFLETRRNRLIGRNFHSWSFTYGALGTNIGYDFQSWAHQALVQNRGIPLGWPTQISQGGSFAWLIQNSMLLPLRWRLYDKVAKGAQISSKFGWDMAYGIQTAVGYYTYFGGQTSIRIGKINHLNYMNTRTSFMQSGDKRKMTPSYNTIENTESSTEGSSGIRPTLAGRYWEHFAFAYAAPRLWARNSLITGQKHVPSVYALDSKYLNTFVLEVEFGYTMTRTTVASRRTGGDAEFYADRMFQITLSAKARSPEYRYSPYTRWHYWGSVNFIFPIDFRHYKLERP